MKTITTILAAAMVAMFSSNSIAAGSVLTESLATQHSAKITDVSHLSDLVTHPSLPQNVWWQGAVIATPVATRLAEQQKFTLLAELQACATTASAKQRNTVRAIIEQVQSISVTGRQFVNLDIDALHADKKIDWQLEGDYNLYIKPRPSTVEVLGAISEPGSTYWRPSTTVSHYLEGHRLLSGAERDNVTIIYPNGQTAVAPVAYWNEQHREAEPGSVIWVGFDICKDSASSTSIDEQIISLLTRRIPN